MTARKRIVRQRLWSGEKADARAVGENMRNIDSAVLDSPPQRIVSFDSQVYPSDGFVLSSQTNPLGAVVILVQRVDGSWQSANATPEIRPTGQGTYAVKVGGLTVGERYATIRMVVYG